MIQAWPFVALLDLANLECALSEKINMQTEEVKQLLQTHLPDCDITVDGDGRHFDITVVGDVFEGLNAVKKQQLIYAGLNQQIADGTIHAINMLTYTRDEWQQQS